MLRLRFIHNDVTLDQLHSDSYYEFGDFVKGEFQVTSSEKEGKIAIFEMEKTGSVKDSNSNERNPVRITKDIYMEGNEIEARIRINFEQIPNREDILKRIISNLRVGIDLPFFFNGNTDNFRWESSNMESIEHEKHNLLQPFQYLGNILKVYDETYDLNLEFEIITDEDTVKINSFPIIAYAYTEKGYKQIYQGINICPLIKINKSVEFHLKIKIF